MAETTRDTAGTTRPADDDLAFAGIAEQARLVDQGAVSSRELVELYLGRIERLDPQLNAFRAVHAEQALAAADDADTRRAAGDSAPLLGVPVAIKDDADVAGDVTTHGTDAYGEPARADSEVVRRLREAGAVMIGRTTVPELQIWPFTETKAWGITRNPWNRDRTPGAAVAAGLVGAALGSDGAGSIRIPSACCGLFGIKPQRGRVSLAPKGEAWHGMSTFGPIARTVEDAALWLDVTQGIVPGDVARCNAPSRPFVEAAAERPGRLRIALSFKQVPGIITKVDPEVRAGVESTAELLRSLGHEVVERDPDWPNLMFPHVVARYLRGIHDDAGAMAHPERLERRTRAMARLGGLWAAPAFQRMRALEGSLAARVLALFDDVDVLLSPVLAWKPIEIGRWEGRGALWTVNNSASFVAFCPPWNAIGNPAASVPAGMSSDGLPLAAQLIGRPDDEATLLALAAQIEAERPWADRRPPIS